MPSVPMFRTASPISLVPSSSSVHGRWLDSLDAATCSIQATVVEMSSSWNKLTSPMKNRVQQICLESRV